MATYEEIANEIEAIASDLSDAESTLSDLSDIEGYVDDAKSSLDDALNHLNNIEVPDLSDLDLDGLKDRLDELAEVVKGMAQPIKSLTLIVKQGSAEQKFYLHPETPVQIEIVQD